MLLFLSKSVIVEPNRHQFQPRVKPSCAALALANIALGQLFSEGALLTGLRVSGA
jgi:hypothetical protein